MGQTYVQIARWKGYISIKLGLIFFLCWQHAEYKLQKIYCMCCILNIQCIFKNVLWTALLTEEVAKFKGLASTRLLSDMFKSQTYPKIKEMK